VVCLLEQVRVDLEGDLGVGVPERRETKAIFTPLAISSEANVWRSEWSESLPGASIPARLTASRKPSPTWR
jgi:hypothetical protein